MAKCLVVLAFLLTACSQPSGIENNQEALTAIGQCRSRFDASFHDLASSAKGMNAEHKLSVLVAAIERRDECDGNAVALVRRR